MSCGPLIAAQAAALALASDGRAYVGLARGAWLDGLGIDTSRPLARLADTGNDVHLRGLVWLQHDDPPDAHDGIQHRTVAVGQRLSSLHGRRGHQGLAAPHELHAIGFE